MRPIFVGGCPRSGTTLLGAMLGAHERYLAVPEMPFKLWLLEGSPEQRDLTLGDSRFAAWGVPLAAGARGRAAIEALVRAYAERTGRAAVDVWIDHTPTSLRHAVTLAETFPDARFVHLVRDGRAVAASLRRVDWGANDAESAAFAWLRDLAHGLAAEDRGAVRIRYEDLVSRPAETLASLCAALGLEYTAEMVRGDGFDVPAYTREQHRLVGKPPVPSRIDAWRDELTARDVEIFESITGDMLAALGYAPDYGPGARVATKGERLQARARQLRARAVNSVRKRRRRRLSRAGSPSP